MLCKQSTHFFFSITCAHSIISKIWIKCSQLCKKFSWLISLYKAAEGAHTLFLVCHTQKKDKLRVHTHVHARACRWHGPAHVCAQAASPGTSCTATVAVPALVTHTNRSRCAQQKSWEWALHGHGTRPSGCSYWTSEAWSHQLRHPCVPWVCSGSSQSAFSRWTLPKRKPAGAFWLCSGTQTKAQLVGVIWRQTQSESPAPELC